jgi:hypothetical protein
VSPATPDEPSGLTVVFQTGDAIVLALAKAALEAAEIPFVTQGEGVQDLLGIGRMPGGFNLATGPVRLHVDAGDLERAREALADLAHS